MKKLFLLLVVATSAVLQVMAGGLVTNSNQSAAYYRMLARGASISGDAVYYNPAGLAFFDQGLTISLNTQMIWMKRTINNDFSALSKNEFVGNLYVPFFPGVYAAYKTGNLTFSLGFNPPAGGGSIEFKEGIPMLELPVSDVLNKIPVITKYRMDAMMKGSSIVYGVQAGAAYQINEMIGVFGGVRMMFASNGYEGYLKDVKFNPEHPNPQLSLNGSWLNSAELAAAGNAIEAQADAIPPAALADPQILEQYTQLKMLAGGLKLVSVNTTDQFLDVQQKGKGIAPILGVHLNFGNLNLAAKYEFKTKITIKNDTKKNAMNMYPDGKELRSDVPAVLSLAGSYDIIPALRFSVTYLHHFEPQATIESWVPDATHFEGGYIVQRQKLIKKGTNEYQAGLEWLLNGKLTLSTGCQWSDVRVSDLWQNDIAHNLKNLTWGLGAAYHFSDRLTLNIGGLYTWYNTSSVKSTDYIQTYDRTNKALAIGIDFRF